MIHITGAVMSKINEIKALIISRDETIFLWSWMTALTCLIIGQGFPPLQLTLLAIFSSMLIATSVYIYNDYIDIKMDEQHEEKKNRPLVTGSASVQTALQLSIVTGLAGLLISAYVNVMMFLSSFAFLFIFSIYSIPQIKLKKRFIMKDLVIASGFFICSLIGSTALTGGIHWQGVFAGFNFGVLGFLVNPGINDSFDVEVDRKFGVKSLAAELSWHTQVQMLGAAIIYIIGVSVFAVFNLGFNMILPIPILLFGLVVLRKLPTIYPEFNAEKVLKTRNTVKAFVFFTHIMYLVSSLNLGFTLL